MATAIDRIIKQAFGGNNYRAAAAAEAARSEDAPVADTPAPQYLKPEGMSDDSYADLQQKGFTPEAISKAFAPYDPGSDSAYIEQLAQLTRPQQSKPHMSQSSRSVIANLGDSMRLLGELAAAGQGAHVARRGKDGYAVTQMQAYDDAMQQQYLRQMDEHRNRTFTAQLQGFVNGQRRHDQTRKDIAAAIDRKRELDRRAASDNALQEHRKAELERRQSNDAAGLELRKKSLSLAEQRTASTVARNKAYVARTQSTAGKGGKQSVLYVPARDGDPDAVTDAFGKKVVAYSIDPGQREQLYTQGRSMMKDGALNPQNHPELFTEKQTSNPLTPVQTVPTTDKALIVAAVAAELYGQGEEAPYDGDEYDEEEDIDDLLPVDDDDDEEDDDDEMFSGNGLLLNYKN